MTWRFIIFQGECQIFFQVSWDMTTKIKMTRLTIVSGKILLSLFFFRERELLFFCLQQARAEKNGLEIPSWILGRNWNTLLMILMELTSVSEKVGGSSPFWLWERTCGYEALLIPTSPLIFSSPFHEISRKLTAFQTSKVETEQKLVPSEMDLGYS